MADDRCRLNEDPFISELFHTNHQKLVRYAYMLFRKYGGQIDPEGRAEDIVQETFYLACEKREELLQSEEPIKWLLAAATFKVREALKADRKWAKGLLLLPSEDEVIPSPEPEVLPELMEPEDYKLIKRLYLEGYTYKELCDEKGISKSNLGMRVNRIKKVLKKKYGKIFD